MDETDTAVDSLDNDEIRGDLPGRQTRTTKKGHRRDAWTDHEPFFSDQSNQLEDEIDSWVKVMCLVHLLFYEYTGYSQLPSA